MKLVDKIQVNGVECDLYADMHGKWRIHLDDKGIGFGDTLGTAVAQARAAINKSRAKFSVEFITTKGGERGVAYSIHAGTGNIMVKVDGLALQVGSSTHVFKPDVDQDELGQYFERKQQMASLFKLNQKFEGANTFILGHAVERAIKESESSGP